MKILLDLNGKGGREDVFKPTVRAGVSVVNFATSKNLIVKSTMFSCCNIHKYT
jgi:hypothetical protein